MQVFNGLSFMLQYNIKVTFVAEDFLSSPEQYSKFSHVFQPKQFDYSISYLIFLKLKRRYAIHSFVLFFFKRGEYFVKKNLFGKGSILFIALTAFGVISILSVTIVGIALNDMNQTQNTEKRTKAHYYALSGIEIARGMLENIETRNENGIFSGNMDENNMGLSKLVFESSNNLGTDFNYDNLKDYVRSRNNLKNWKIVCGFIKKRNGDIKIASFGNVGDITRTISLFLRPERGIFDMAIFGMDSIKISGTTSDEAKVTGKIGTNSTEDGAINFDGTNATLDGTAFIIDPIKNASDVIVGQTVTVEDLVEVRDYQLPFYPALDMSTSLVVTGEETISTDIGYKTVDVPNGDNLIFDLGTSPDIILRTESLNLEGTITMNSTGTVWLYIDSVLTLNNIEGNQARLIIVYGGTDPVKISGQIVCESLGIYAPNALIELSGQSAIKGAMIAKEAQVKGISEVVSFQYDEDLSKLNFPTYGGGYAKTSYIETWSE